MNKPKLEIISINKTDIISTSCICHNNVGVNAPHLPHSAADIAAIETLETQVTVCQEFLDLCSTKLNANYNSITPIPGAVCEEHGQIYHCQNAN